MVTDLYGEACDVQAVRTFRDGRQLGAGYDFRDPETWFVYDREIPPTRWHKHCGPFSTIEQAKGWILAIHEDEGRS